MLAGRRDLRLVLSAGIISLTGDWILTIGRLLMVFALVTSVGEGIMSTLFTPFVENVLHGTPQDLGLILAAQAVGGIVPVLAIQGAGYVVAGLVMLRGLKDTEEHVSLAPGTPVAACSGTA
jgi:hypothetical protein